MIKKIMMMVMVVAIGCLVMGSVFAGPLVTGQLPLKINFQGVLTDSAGRALGNEIITFGIMSSGVIPFPPTEDLTLGSATTDANGFVSATIDFTTHYPSMQDFTRGYDILIFVDHTFFNFQRLQAAPYAFYAYNANKIGGMTTTEVINAATKEVVAQGMVGDYVQKAGDTMTGKLSLEGPGILEVYKESKTSSPSIQLTRKWGAESTLQFTIGGNPYAVNIASNASKGINILTGTTPASSMVIDESGRVGIGTTAPDQKLHINAAGAGAYIRITANNNPNGSYFGSLSGRTLFQNQDNGNMEFWLGSQGTTLSNKMTITPDGYVGIGAYPPTEKLDVNGGIKAAKLGTNMTATSAALQAMNTGSGPGIWAESATGPAMVIYSQNPATSLYINNTNAAQGAGLLAVADAGTAGSFESQNGAGVMGSSSNSSGGSFTGKKYGVLGKSTGSGSTAIGVYGYSANGVGVYGNNIKIGTEGPIIRTALYEKTLSNNTLREVKFATGYTNKIPISLTAIYAVDESKGWWRAAEKEGLIQYYADTGEIYVSYQNESLAQGAKVKIFFIFSDP